MNHIQARIDLKESKGSMVSASVLGVNAEMIQYTHDGLVSDRLNNPKFCGPADGQTGIAPGWSPITHNMGGMHCKLVSGMSLSGGESQMVHVYGGRSGRGLVQNGLAFKAGEVLEVEIWARVRHHPVQLKLNLGTANMSIRYDSALIEVDTGYWKKYTATLRTDRDDREGNLTIVFVTNGQVWFDQVHLRPVESDHISREMMNLLRELKLPSVRFPGGSIADCYYWRNGTGPVHLRPSHPDPCFKWRVDYEFGIEEYLQMCCDQQMAPFITIGIGSSTPEDAGEYMEYCVNWYRRQGLEVPEAYIMIGNEQLGVWEPSHMTGEMYVEVLKTYVPVVRANYPGCRIIAIGYEESAGVDGPNTPLRELVLKDAGHLIDIISVHHYSNAWSQDSEEWAGLVAKQSERAKAKLSQLLADCRAAGCSAQVALTEWGFRNEAMHWDGKGFFEPDDAPHGTFFADMVHTLTRMAPDIAIANYYNLINAMGMVRNERGFVSETGVSRLYRLYRPAFPGEVLHLEIESPRFANETAMMDALAVRSSDGIYLFVINRSSSKSFRVKLDSTMGKVQSVCRMRAANMNAPYMEENMDVEEDKYNLELLPLSVTRLFME